MRIIFSEHLKLRLKVRKIPKELPKKVYQKAKERYFDNKTCYSIAVSTAKYAGKKRKMVIVYEKSATQVKIITVYPTTDKEIKNRLKSGRWSHEKN